MHGTRVRALVPEDPTCRGAAKSMCHNYWACALEPASHSYWARVPQLLKPTRLEPACLNYWAHVPQLLKPARSSAHVPRLLSLRAATTGACMPRAHDLQQEKPPQWEALALQRRVAPTHHNWRKPMRSNEDPTQPKINKIKKKRSSTYFFKKIKK